tara:strand:- start:696 stop:857 length:162 start_codon:yes stop_codon:yes gene_type:complete
VQGCSRNKKPGGAKSALDREIVQKLFLYEVKFPEWGKTFDSDDAGPVSLSDWH